MKKLTINITRLIIISALFASAAVKADEAEQLVTVVQVHTEVAKELTEVKANLMQELQQQVNFSIKQQVNSTFGIIAESVN